MKPEKPDFLRKTVGLESLPSSEYRLELTEGPSVGALGPRPFSARVESMAVKLAEVRSTGLERLEPLAGLTS